MKKAVQTAILTFAAAVLSVFAAVSAFAHESATLSGECAAIKYDPQNLFETEVEVEGPRGSLRFKAILDTGASKTLIPSSIMEGIGYQSRGQQEFTTASGDVKFDSGIVKSLSFLGITFRNATVFVDNPVRNRLGFGLPRVDYQVNAATGRIERKKRRKPEEKGLIGMSQLSQTVFSYEKGFLRICR